MKEQKINDFVFVASAGTWVIIAGIMIALGKKLADFVYSATIGKFRFDIGKIVEEKLVPLEKEVQKYKQEVLSYKQQLHGLVAKNEVVLLETLDINDKAFKKLDQFNKILNLKL